MPSQMSDNPSERADNLGSIDSDKRICAQDSIERRMFLFRTNRVNRLGLESSGHRPSSTAKHLSRSKGRRERASWPWAVRMDLPLGAPGNRNGGCSRKQKWATKVYRSRAQGAAHPGGIRSLASIDLVPRGDCMVIAEEPPDQS